MAQAEISARRSRSGYSATFFSVLPEGLKAPFRRVLGKEHPFGLAVRERKRLEHLPPRHSTTVTLFGERWLVPDPPSFLSAHREIFVEQQYRFRTRRKNPRIIDAGANIGLASLYFALQYPGASIEAYEADPSLYEILVKNLSLHPACSKVQARCAAVWTRSGNVHFQPDGADSGAISESGPIIVTGLRLADILAESPVEFLKIDIEGAEYEVVADCARALEGVESMVVEYHGVSGGKPRLGKLLRILEEAGFRYYLRHEGISNAHPLDGIRTEGRFELQANISCIRE